MKNYFHSALFRDPSVADCLLSLKASPGQARIIARRLSASAEMRAGTLDDIKGLNHVKTSATKALYVKKGDDRIPAPGLTEAIVADLLKCLTAAAEERFSARPSSEFLTGNPAPIFVSTKTLSQIVTPRYNDTPNCPTVTRIPGLYGVPYITKKTE